MTLLRTRRGPTIAAIAFAICALIGPISQFAIITKFVGGTDGLFQLPHTILNFVAAIAFWAYMHDGRRPNLYFRRRMRAG